MPPKHNQAKSDRPSSAQIGTSFTREDDLADEVQIALLYSDEPEPEEQVRMRMLRIHCRDASVAMRLKAYEFKAVLRREMPRGVWTPDPHGTGGIPQNLPPSHQLNRRIHRRRRR